MREALLILGVLVVILVLTAIRYRRQIAAVMQIWRSVKAMKRQMTGQPDERDDPVSGGPLINCAKCGTWVPEQRAIKLRGGVVYCSSACLESTRTVH